MCFLLTLFKLTTWRKSPESTGSLGEKLLSYLAYGKKWDTFFLAGKFKFFEIAGFFIEFTCIYHAPACEPVGSHPGYPIPPHEIRNPNNPGGDANSRLRKHGRDSPRASF